MNKQNLLAEITHSINKINTLILHEKKTMIFSNKEVIHYPLFFSDEVVPDISKEYMDSCATSIGLISYKLLNNTDEDESIINKAVRGILLMQNQDKSWSSVLYQGDSNQGKQLDGIINDTCFALNALITCSFLDKEYLYDDTVLSEFHLKSISDRIKLVMESVKWFDTNKKDKGWYYTTTKHFTDTNSITPTASSTISVINTLNLIINKLQLLEINIDVKQTDIDLIDSLIKNAIDALFDMQKESGGFSKKRGSSESLAQTSNALISLLQLDTNYIKTEYEPRIALSIKWFLSKVRSIYDKKKIDVTDFIDEYDQIIEENKKPLKRPIRHETHLDTHVFYALLKISQSKKYLKSLLFLDKFRLYFHLKKSLHHILKLQTENGQYSGAFKCRRTLQSEKYPIYSTYQALKGLQEIQINFDEFYKSYSTINNLYTRLILFFFSVIIFVFVLIFGNDTSKWVVFILGIFSNIIAQPILNKLNSML